MKRKKEYMQYDKYVELVARIDHLRFMTQLVIENCNNIIDRNKKRERRLSIK